MESEIMKDFQLLPGEEIIKTASGDCWETPSMFKSQVPGRYTFTNQRIIFEGNGIIEKLRVKFAIPYLEIKTIEPYLVVFFKTGILVWMKNGDKYRLSLRKRQEYMDLIQSHIN